MTIVAAVAQQSTACLGMAASPVAGAYCCARGGTSHTTDCASRIRSDARSSLVAVHDLG